MTSFDNNEDKVYLFFQDDISRSCVRSRTRSHDLCFRDHGVTAIPDPKIGKSNLDNLVNIDKLLSQQGLPLLILLSQNLTTNQLTLSIAPIITCTA